MRRRSRRIGISQLLRVRRRRQPSQPQQRQNRRPHERANPSMKARIPTIAVCAQARTARPNRAKLSATPPQQLDNENATTVTRPHPKTQRPRHAIFISRLSLPLPSARQTPSAFPEFFPVGAPLAAPARVARAKTWPTCLRVTRSGVLRFHFAKILQCLRLTTPARESCQCIS